MRHINYWEHHVLCKSLNDVFRKMEIFMPIMSMVRYTIFSVGFSMQVPYIGKLNDFFCIIFT
jgi:hypothetical protein